MASLTKRSEVLREVRDTFGQVPHWVETMPDSVIGGFWGLMRDFQLAETKIPNKYKELIGIAVSGATRCKYCQLFHTEAARLNGATDDEIREAAAMAGVTMLGSTYLNALGPDYEAFEKETLELVAHVKAQAAKIARKPVAEARV
jgi:AhpD family alkylhydroperoxidase